MRPTTSLFGFWYQLPARAGVWAVGIIFSLIGILVLYFAPAFVQTATDPTAARAAMMILGIVFLGLGLVTLVAMIVEVILDRRAPHRSFQWFYWSYVIIALFGAALFAVPAIFAFPIVLVAFFFRPNGLFPAYQTNAAENMLIACTFSISGLLALALLFFLVRRSYRERPSVEST